jgi:hypothetical protein
VVQSVEEMGEEARRAYVARRKEHEAEQSEHRRQAGQVSIWLDRSPNDARTFTRPFQAELYEVIGPLLREKELKVEAPFMALDSADAFSGYIGQLIIPLAQIASPIVSAALVAWLKRPSRNVRVEFYPSGRVKTVEAKTTEQVLSIVKEVDQEARADPKSKADD